jgi:hypothetical protein
MRSKLFLMMLLMGASVSPLHGQEKPNASASPSPTTTAAPSSDGNNAPLTPDELREAILRIEYGILAGKEADLLKRSMAERDTLSQREKDIAARELQTEKDRTALANQKADIEKARGDFYEGAFKSVTKGTSVGCKIARVFTLGLAKCGR